MIVAHVETTTKFFRSKEFTMFIFKKFVFVCIALSLAAGCVESVPKADFDRAMAENRRLAEEKALLLSLASSPSAPSPAAPPQGQPPVVTAPVAPNGGNGMTFIPTPPPAQPQVYGPPQNWAWLHTPPKDCETGKFSLPIWNRTAHKFTTVLIDGKAFMVRGSGGVLPHLPPGETVYICLESLGLHSIAVVAYEPRMRVLQETGHGRESIDFSNRNMMDGRQYPYIITDSSFNGS